VNVMARSGHTGQWSERLFLTLSAILSPGEALGLIHPGYPPQFAYRFPMSKAFTKESDNIEYGEAESPMSCLLMPKIM
jgi:hypothetical protein